MSRCLEPSVADGLLHGRLSDDELARALKHAAGCPDCRRLLSATGRPAPELQAAPMDQIQDRLTTWRAARRAPLMPAFPWHKGHEVDRYVIIRSVGGTEDGVIYEAFDPEREDRVVVKQLDLRIDDPPAPALMTVANKLCQFSHPNVLQMLSVGVHGGSVYVVHEFVKGTTLAQAAGDDARQLIALYAEAGRGLAAAHDAGIVHGCFSGASCVVGRDGRVRVLDFAIGEARAQRSVGKPRPNDAWMPSADQVSSEDSFVGFIPNRRHSTSGQFESIVLAARPNALGPRIYAAPELVLGTPPTPASDQFAFCAALFHRLYGHPPYDGDTISLWLRDLLKGQVARPPARADVPPQVVDALLRGLEREPGARFDRMASLLARLQRTRPLLGSRKRTVVAAIAAGAAIAVGGIVVASTLRGPGQGQGQGQGSTSRAASCDRALAGWNDLWSTTRQAELTKAGSAAAADAWPVLHTRLDAWIGGWRKATQGFCSLPDDRALRDCTSRAHAEAADLLHLVADGSPARMVRAAAAADALPTFEQCASAAPSPGAAPLPAVEADVRRRLGMLDEADQLIAKPPDDPAQRGYQSLVRGHTAVDRGDLMEARKLFESATFEAHAAHQPELGMTAAVQRLALACSASERSLWSGYLSAYPIAPAQRAAAANQFAYRSALAQSLACEGKLVDAIALRQQTAQALHGETTAAAGAASLELARALIGHGELAAAETAAHDASTIYGAVYGVRHPLSQTARLTVAEAELGSPSGNDASAAIERVVTELGDHKEPDAVRGRALLLQGRLADARGNHDEALRLVQRASQEYEAALGGAHPELANALLTAGDLLLAAGHDQDAEASYRQVAAIFDTLGHSESIQLAHARAGIQLARWGARPPADASDTLQWGLAPTGDGIDPAVGGWLAQQLGQRAAARGDLVAALAHYRAAVSAWRQAGDPRGVASSLTEGALLATQLRDPQARALLDQALPLASPADKPRLQGALGKLLWPVQRDRARLLIRAALNDLPDSSADAADLKRWLKRHDER